nr:hypothetical protein [Tanacetum cinerariifolium]
VTASLTYGKSSFINASQLPDDPDMLKLEDITYSDDEDDVGTEADFNNLETSITVSLIPTTRVHKDHPISQIIGDLSLTTQTRSMTRMVKDQERKSASTPIDTEKSLLNDPDGEDVDVHTYRSMIGSLMYLTSSRPDIMFVCKKQTVVATSFTEAEYVAAASCCVQVLWIQNQLLDYRLISWQCKKQTVVATSSTEVEYVAAASGYAQVLWIQNQLLDYGYNFTHTVTNILQMEKKEAIRKNLSIGMERECEIKVEGEKFSISSAETIESSFTRAKVTTIKEAKDLATLSLEELISNLKVYEMVLNDSVISITFKEKVNSLALKAKVIMEQTSDNSYCQGK